MFRLTPKSWRRRGAGARAANGAIEVVAAAVEAMAVAHTDHLGQVHAFEARKPACRRQRRFRGCGGAGGDAAVLCAAVAQEARQLACIDIGDGDDAMPAQVGIEWLLRAPVAGQARQIANDQSSGVNLRRLLIDSVAAGVADVRIGERDDLTRVRRVGQDFLVAGDRRVEHHLANGLSLRTNRNTAEQRAISECKNCRCHQRLLSSNATFRCSRTRGLAWASPWKRLRASGNDTGPMRVLSIAGALE